MVVVILLAIKVNFSKLILAFLLVTGCIKVGKYEESNYQRADFDRKTVKLSSNEVILIEKCLALVAGVKVKGWTAKTTRKRSFNPKKVGPFLLLCFSLSVSFLYLIRPRLAKFISACVKFVVLKCRTKHLSLLLSKLKKYITDLRNQYNITETKTFYEIISDIKMAFQATLNKGILKITIKLKYINKILKIYKTYNEQKIMSLRGPQMHIKLIGFLRKILGTTDLLDLTRSKAISDFVHKSPSLIRNSFSIKWFNKRWTMVVPTLFISSIIILSLIIELELLKQTIEPNPGGKKNLPGPNNYFVQLQWTGR
jgi:hypothetical protein